MASNEYHTGYLQNPNPNSLGVSNLNFNNRFDAGESRLAKIQAKISVEDFEYLKGFANSNKRIDENDPRLAKIRAKISEEDVHHLKGLANSNFNKGLGANNREGLGNSNCNGGFGANNREGLGNSNCNGGFGANNRNFACRPPGNDTRVDICVIL